MNLQIENVERMTPEQERDFWTVFAADLSRDTGAAARGHLAAGFPVYVQTADTPKSMIEKRFPDGRRQLVQFDLTGEHVVRELLAS